MTQDPPPPPPISPDAGEADGSVALPPAESDAGDPDALANLRLAHGAAFASYLTDGVGRPLYMFAGDVAGAPRTACLGDCARDWPPFHVAVAQPSIELADGDVSRFHRQDGAWQTSYKGHALYYRASEEGLTEVTGDGADGRWFVARDYLAFLATARTFTPLAGSPTNDTFLTDGLGRTLYICLDDEPSTATSPAISSCEADCTQSRPIVIAKIAELAGRPPTLPSVLAPSALSELQRPDGLRQLTYRGWPLYYFDGDIAAGATEGHNENAWRAIEPVSFGLAPEPLFGN